MKGIFDWLKQINTIKSDPDTFSDKDWEVWNSYMIHRFLSMNKDYLELVNETQQIMPQNKKEIYSIYREYIPKNNHKRHRILHIFHHIHKRYDYLLEYKVHLQGYK